MQPFCIRWALWRYFFVWCFQKSWIRQNDLVMALHRLKQALYVRIKLPWQEISVRQLNILWIWRIVMHTGVNLLFCERWATHDWIYKLFCTYSGIPITYTTVSSKKRGRTGNNSRSVEVLGKCQTEKRKIKCFIFHSMKLTKDMCPIEQKWNPCKLDPSRRFARWAKFKFAFWSSFEIKSCFRISA